VEECFGSVEVEKWDAPLVRLPDTQAVAEYLFGRGMVRAEAEEAASRLRVPLTVTKRGCLVWGYRQG
jgi:hypothetical protein